MDGCLASACPWKLFRDGSRSRRWGAEALVFTARMAATKGDSQSGIPLARELSGTGHRKFETVGWILDWTGSRQSAGEETGLLLRMDRLTSCWTRTAPDWARPKVLPTVAWMSSVSLHDARMRGSWVDLDGSIAGRLPSCIMIHICQPSQRLYEMSTCSILHAICITRLAPSAVHHRPAAKLFRTAR